MAFMVPAVVPPPLNAQAPRIGVIDTYGLRKLPLQSLQQVLAVRPGQPLPASKEDVEERLEQLPNVVRARLEAACCEAGGTILYVGIEEKGSPHFDYRNPPTEGVVLPDELVAAYRRVQDALAAAYRRGGVVEGLTKGHSLVSDPAARTEQDSLVALAEQHQLLLQKVLRTSVDEDHRAMAAYLIGYYPAKARIVNDLQYALTDPDVSVRRQAVRSITALAVYARANNDPDVRVSPTWLIEMLNSLLWADRFAASEALATLSETRDAGLLALLRERALPVLAEMARWQHLPHALPAYLVVGRALEWPEDRLQEEWKQGRREAVLAPTVRRK